LIVDEIGGPPGLRTIHQFWHVASEDHIRVLVTRHPFAVLPCQRSRCFGQQEAGVVARVGLSAELPAMLYAGIALQKNVRISIDDGDSGPLFSMQSELQTISISAAEFLNLT
jgi:hypothetical protein